MVESGFVLKEHFEVLAEFQTYAELTAAEVDKIAEYRTAGIQLCNLTGGGDGTPGHKPVFTEEWLARLSVAAKKHHAEGGKNGFAGKKHTEESKQKRLSTINKRIADGTIPEYNANTKGKTIIELYGEERAREISEKISKGNTGKLKGRKRSDEWERNRIAAVRGRVVGGVKYRLMRGDEDIIWEKSLSDFVEKYLNIPRGTINKNKANLLYKSAKTNEPTHDGWLVSKIYPNDQIKQENTQQ